MGFFSATYFGGEGVVTGSATLIGDGESIYAKIGETKTVSVTCNQTVEDLNLEVIFETSSSLDIAIIDNASITKTTTAASFALPADSTTVERTLRVSVRRTDTDEAVWSGKLFVTRTAQGD